MPIVELKPDKIEVLRQSRVMKAYRDLFGDDEKTRSDMQRIVWEDLRVAGYIHQPVFSPDKNGTFDPLSAAFRDGRRSIALYIAANVAFAPSLEQQQQPQ